MIFYVKTVYNIYKEGRGKLPNMKPSREFLEKYINELDIDVKINQFNLKEVQLSLPGIKHKWAGRLIRHKIDLNDLNLKRNQKINEITSQIEHQSPTPLPKLVIEKTAVKHPVIVEIDTEITYIKLTIDLLEKTEKTLSSMTFDISNIVKIITIETT